MNDPYKVLGVDRSASDAQIKDAYRELAKKYHPDNYSGSPIADLAGEKMKEINEAYDTIMKERKEGTQSSYGSADQQASSAYQSSYQSSGAYQSSSGVSDYNDVRRFITQNRITDAEQILNGVPPEKRSAEWYFLKGSVLYRRGWLEEAYRNFSTACSMDPNNMEYRAAMNQATNNRSGNYGYGGYGGYNPNMNRASGGCNACDVCSSLMCADCCCECMGGDLIRCC